MPSHLSVHDHLCHCSLEAGELRRLKISQDVALLNVQDLPQHGQVVVLESRRTMVEDRLLILDPVMIEVVHSIVVQVVAKRCDQQRTDLQVAEQSSYRVIALHSPVTSVSQAEGMSEVVVRASLVPLGHLRDEGE